MPTYAIEQLLNGSIEVERNTYNPNKINLLGEHLDLYNLGSGDGDKFLSPKLTKVIRFSEISGITITAIHVEQYGPLHYLFLALQGAAAPTRTFAVYFYNKETEEVGGGGINTITFPTTTNHTLRGIRPTLQFYTTGTIEVSGTTVTGSGTNWITDGMCAGSRIGFGSTNSFAITSWYEIESVDSNTGITLNGSAGTITAGTPYVIEDLRMGVTTTNATLTNGGMFLIKGLRLDGLSGGLVIPAATTVDNIRAVYKLNDGNPVTNTISSGIASGEFVSWQEEYVYVPNNVTTTSLRFYKYNIRAPLSLTGGAALLTGSDMVITGTQAVSGGTIVLFNNGRYAVTKHGPGANVPCIYIACTNRIMRAEVADIVNGGTNFFKDQMIEVPPGGIQSLPISNFAQADYSPTLDKFIISGYTAPNGRIYVTDYKTDGSQLDLTMGLVWNSFDGSSSSNPIFPKLQAQAPYVWAAEGILYIANFGSAPTGQVYIYPAFAAHWTFVDETDNRAILPKITLSGLPRKLNRVYVISNKYIPGPNESDKTTEPYRVFYRVNGIDDNSGEWVEVDRNGSLESLTPTNEIQFSAAFRTMGDICIPTRIISLAMTYESDDALPDQYQWNLGDSNTVDGTFGFIQINPLNDWPIRHTIKIFRSDNNTLALEQNSDGTSFGIFEYFDEDEWVAGLGSNISGTRRRFRPTSSLPGGVNLYAILSVSNS
jgi:hypothetical protein